MARFSVVRPLILSLLLACGGTSRAGTPNDVVVVTSVGGSVNPGSGTALLGQHLPTTGVPIRFDMDSADELEQHGWWHWSSGSSTFRNGILTTQTDGYEEWMQRDDRAPSHWWSHVDNSRGWAIETRMRVVQASAECGSAGMWIHDRSRLLQFRVLDGSVRIAGEIAEVPNTDQFHIYRIEGRADWVRVAVDGQVVIEARGDRTTNGAGTQSLTFGDMGGCRGSVAEWDWLGYDTQPELVDAPCTFCRPGESFRISQLRERIRSAVPQVDQLGSSGSENADEHCLGFRATDLLVRRIGVAMANQGQAHQVANELQQLAPIVDPRSARGVVTVMDRWQERMGRGMKPRAREMPMRRPQIPYWAQQLRGVASTFASLDSENGWRQVSTFLLQAASQPVHQNLAVEVFRELASDAAQRCPSQ